MTTNKVDVTIIGAGLTGLTLAYYLKKAGKSVCILEKMNRAGGVIHTVKKNGFTYETGPNSGSMGSYEMAELFEDLQGKCELENANEASKQRWIWKNNKWNALPSGLWKGITTPLFSLSDKLRIIGEPFRKAGINPYETVSELVRRRLGKSILNYAVNPFIGGIYAGSPDKLVTKFALPKLYNLEQRYGSFIGGAIKKGKEPKSEQDKKATRKVFAAKGGMQNLINALVSEIGKENIVLEVSGVIIQPQNTGFVVNYTGGSVESDKVVTTTGSYALPEMLPFIEEGLLKHFSELEYAKVVQVAVGYNNWHGIPMKAFGGLVPKVEDRNMLGILFPASIFTGRAPEKGAILSVFMGGVTRPDIFAKADDELKKIALNEIKETLKCDSEPDMIEIHRYEKAIPQYEASTKQRYEAVEQIEAKYKGLYLAGNLRNGIGMADRVKQAVNLAKMIVADE